jgi:hypothetical protein
MIWVNYLIILQAQNSQRQPRREMKPNISAISPKTAQVTPSLLFLATSNLQ